MDLLDERDEEDDGLFALTIASASRRHKRDVGNCVTVSEAMELVLAQCSAWATKVRTPVVDITGIHAVNAAGVDGATAVAAPDEADAEMNAKDDCSVTSPRRLTESTISIAAEGDDGEVAGADGVWECKVEAVEDDAGCNKTSMARGG